MSSSSPELTEIWASSKSPRLSAKKESTHQEVHTNPESSNSSTSCSGILSEEVRKVTSQTAEDNQVAAESYFHTPLPNQTTSSTINRASQVQATSAQFLRINDDSDYDSDATQISTPEVSDGSLEHRIPVEPSSVSSVPNRPTTSSTKQSGDNNSNVDNSKHKKEEGFIETSASRGRQFTNQLSKEVSLEERRSRLQSPSMRKSATDDTLVIRALSPNKCLPLQISIKTSSRPETPDNGNKINLNASDNVKNSILNSSEEATKVGSSTNNNDNKEINANIARNVVIPYPSSTTTKSNNMQEHSGSDNLNTSTENNNETINENEITRTTICNDTRSMAYKEIDATPLSPVVSLSTSNSSNSQIQTNDKISEVVDKSVFNKEVTNGDNSNSIKIVSLGSMNNSNYPSKHQKANPQMISIQTGKSSLHDKNVSEVGDQKEHRPSVAVTNSDSCLTQDSSVTAINNKKASDLPKISTAISRSLQVQEISQDAVAETNISTDNSKMSTDKNSLFFVDKVSLKFGNVPPENASFLPDATLPNDRMASQNLVLLQIGSTNYDSSLNNINTSKDAKSLTQKKNLKEANVENVNKDPEESEINFYPLLEFLLKYTDSPSVQFYLLFTTVSAAVAAAAHAVTGCSPSLFVAGGAVAAVGLAESVKVICSRKKQCMKS